MRYDVNKDNYVRVLLNRPALIKSPHSIEIDLAPAEFASFREQLENKV